MRNRNSFKSILFYSWLCSESEIPKIKLIFYEKYLALKFFWTFFTKTNGKLCYEVNNRDCKYCQERDMEHCRDF